MKRDSYSDQQSHASFQPRSRQSAIDQSQFGQPAQHSSSTSDGGAKWLNKASGWLADKFQTAQNVVAGSGDAIASDQILPALRGTATSRSQAESTNQPLVGVIDAGFDANEHGSKMVEAIQQENPQAKIWQRDGVGTGGGLKSLVEFVDVAKATGHSRAVANLSFDLTEVHPDGSTSTRTQLTAEEQSALAYARDNGVLVIASSGNQGGAMSALGKASQPSDNLIVVGAANGNDRASYSSYGKGLDLVADVGTAGTSLAAAKTTGAIANIWSANPELSSQQVNQILTASATDLKTSGWDAETGVGLLNATGAIDLATHTAPESIVFSGAQLMQQAHGSVGGKTWESRSGTIASERTAGFSDWVHGALDVAGFIPGVGAVADVANAALYAAKGDYANAAMSAAAAVPGIGDAAAAVKLANRGVQAVQAANRGGRATEGASAARAIASRPRPGNPPAPRPASAAVKPGNHGVQAVNRGGRATEGASAARAIASRPRPGNPPTPRPASPPNKPTRPSDKPPAPGRQRPASDRPSSPRASRKPDAAIRQERQPVAVSSGRPPVKPQERKPGLETGSRPATRRQPDHQPGQSAARKPQPKRPESNPGASPSGAPHKPRVEQPTGTRATSSSRRNPDQQSTPDPYSRDEVGSASFRVRDKSVTHSPYVTQDALENGRFFTYTLRNAKGEVRYVGRTSSDNKNGAQEVFLGRMAKGKHETLDDHFDEITEIRIEGYQSNAAANAGAEDVLYTRYQIPGTKVVRRKAPDGSTYKQTTLKAPHTTRSGSRQMLSGGINEGGQQLLNRTNPLSNRPRRIWNPARYSTTLRPDGKLGGFGKIVAFAKDLW